MNSTESIQLKSNSVLVLDDLHRFWLVADGEVAVFRTTLQGGELVGTRELLFNQTVGACLVTHDRRESGPCVVVVALRDTVLEPIEYGASFAIPGREQSFLEGLSKWLYDINGAVVFDKRPLATQLRDTLDRAVPEGQSVSCGSAGISWVVVKTGTLRLFGQTEVTADFPGVVPVSRNAWLTAESSSSVHLAEEETLEESQIQAGVELLYEAFFEYCVWAENREEQRNREWIANVRREEAVATDSALGRFRDIFMKKGTDPKGAEFDDPLLKTLGMIGFKAGITFKSPPMEFGGVAVLGDVLRISGLRMREVRLREGWQNRDGGAMLGYLGEERVPVAILPRAAGTGYDLYDPRSDTTEPLTPLDTEGLWEEAGSFTRPFPAELKRITDLSLFGIRGFWTEIIYIFLLSVVGTLFGMSTPVMNRVIFDDAIPDGATATLIQVGLMLFSVAAGGLFFALTNTYLSLRFQTGVGAAIQSATIDRVLNLPSRFFRRFDSGDLMNRAMIIEEISTEITGVTFTAILSSFTGLFNICLMFYYSSRLAWIGVAGALISTVFTMVASYLIMKRSLQMEQESGVLFGFVVQLLNGVAKLRVAGAENRALNQWSQKYVRIVRLLGEIQTIENVSTIFNFMLSTVASMALYAVIGSMMAPGGALGAGGGTGLTIGSFMAFYSAYGMFMGAVVGLGTTVISIVDSFEKRKLVAPILECELETQDGSAEPGKLKGDVRLEDVHFRYSADGPPVLSGVDFSAEPGEFIAIVGPSGCGKSTLLRVILGLEEPDTGSLRFDNHDLRGLNKRSVRRQMGVVMQNGRLNAGSIYENIGAGHQLTLGEAWQAARDAGFEEDLKAMPMELHTLVSEGGGNLSGGQRQRLLIARALAGDPAVLIFDEATSALDNRTQDIVSESVERRRITRIVVAHRLSTIVNADRIYVLEKGAVVQSGTYQELVNAPGVFQSMMARQVI